MMADRNKGPLYHVSPPLETPSSPQPDSSLPASDLGLHSAVSRGDIGSICYALLGGQPIDSLHQGLQPIHMAAIHGDAAIVEFLLHNGADVNAQTTALSSQPDSKCRTPRKAAEKRNSRHQHGVKSRGSFSFLKSAAVDSSAISGPMGTVPGLHSMQAANIASCDLPYVSEDTSLSCTSDANCMDNYSGATPLHFAVANGHTTCADALLKRGAKIDVADSYGNTPETLAAACACDAMLDVLGHWCQHNAGNDGFWIQAAAEADAKKGSILPLQLPSPDPSVVCFTDSPRAPGLRDQLYDEHPLPVSAMPVQCRIARSATSPLPPQNVSMSSSTANPCQRGDTSHNILPRRHTAGETSTGQRQPQTPLLSASSNCSWSLVDNDSTAPAGIEALSARQQNTPASSRPSSSAPERRVREQSSFYRIKPGSIARPSTSNLARGRLAPGRIVFTSERQGVSASASRSNSTASRRERSYTDSIIEQAWRKYLEFDDENARDSAQCIATNDGGSENASQPLPELWMWKQAAIAVRNRRSKSLSAHQQQQQQQQQ
ncbi:hypothetical protein EV178_003944 [Coemansia sp. RSA 1646]|nr:hypothetical protein EV178_003944 [Coemansia sp. RSA 1646]